jgi:hypothetical protein
VLALICVPRALACHHRLAPTGRLCGRMDGAEVTATNVPPPGAGTQLPPTQRVPSGVHAPHGAVDSSRPQILPAKHCHAVQERGVAFADNATRAPYRKIMVQRTPRVCHCCSHAPALQQALCHQGCSGVPRVLRVLGVLSMLRVPLVPPGSRQPQLLTLEHIGAW